MGRKKINIDWELVDDLLSKFCEGTEVAAALGINFDTLAYKIKERFNLDFSEYKRQKRAIGEKSLRQKQLELAMQGNYSLLIFLGKQYLGQSDKQHTVHELPETSSFTITFRNGD